MNKDFFTKQIQKLVIEFSDKGFTMTKERASQWYEYFKNVSESEFTYAIDNCLKKCERCPSMADVYNTVISRANNYRRVD